MAFSEEKAKERPSKGMDVKIDLRRNSSAAGVRLVLLVVRVAKIRITLDCGQISRSKMG